MKLRTWFLGFVQALSVFTIVLGIASWSEQVATWASWLQALDPRLVGALIGAGVVAFLWTSTAALRSLDWRRIFEGLTGVVAELAAVSRGPTLANLDHHKVEDLYKEIRRIVEPETLDPCQPGNMAFMRSEARDKINLLRPALLRRGERWRRLRRRVVNDAPARWGGYGQEGRRFVGRHRLARGQCGNAPV